MILLLIVVNDSECSGRVKMYFSNLAESGKPIIPIDSVGDYRVLSGVNPEGEREVLGEYHNSSIWHVVNGAIQNPKFYFDDVHKKP